MNIKNFEDRIDDMLFLSYYDKYDIKQWHNEVVEDEINERIQKQLIMLKEQLAVELEKKLHSEILKEEIIKRIDKINSDIEHMKLFMQKAYSPTPRHGSVNIKKTANLPIYDLLWISIRKWQRDTGTSNTELARILSISQRTLRDYDKSARTMSLEKLSNFLEIIGGSIEIDY